MRSGLSYSWHDVWSRRSVAFAGFTDNLSAHYDAATFQAFGELGYRIETPVAAFEPFVNLAHVNLKTRGFVETGGVAALAVAPSTTDTTSTTLGLRASTSFPLGSLQASARGMVGWRHAFGDTTPLSTHAFATGDAFGIAGPPIARNAAIIEAGLDLHLNANANLRMSYNGQFGSGVRDHRVSAKLGVSF